MAGSVHANSNDGCNYKVGGERSIIRRERIGENGLPEIYVIPIIVGGTQCNEPAVIIDRHNGLRRKRCGKHIGKEQ